MLLYDYPSAPNPMRVNLFILEKKLIVKRVYVDLSKKGVIEAEKSGELIKKSNINIDVSYTSYLKRAIKTLTTILQQNKKELKFNTAWQLNERHYGSLTGLDKEETKKKIGCFYRKMEI